MSFTILRQDITKIQADAIVNAANTQLKMGGGVCGAIFKAAGSYKLQKACDKISPIETGQAVITEGFNLPAKHIIHAAGPIYNDWTKEESERLLRAAYENSLKLALEHDIKSIAFPLISSGIYGYPKQEALQVAMDVFRSFLEHNDMDIILAVYDKSSFSISRQLVGRVESYIDEHYIQEHEIKRKRYSNMHNVERVVFESTIQESSAPFDLDEPFSDMLLRLIDQKGMTDVQVYKKANLDRRLFSKIRSVKNYMPSKRTAIALALSLNLSLDETEKFLAHAGYALSHAVKFDVIIEYFITQKNYDIFEINEILFEYDQPLFGT